MTMFRRFPYHLTFASTAVTSSRRTSISRLQCHIRYLQRKSPPSVESSTTASLRRATREPIMHHTNQKPSASRTDNASVSVLTFSSAGAKIQQTYRNTAAVIVKKTALKPRLLTASILMSRDAPLFCIEETDR